VIIKIEAKFLHNTHVSIKYFSIAWSKINKYVIEMIEKNN
jgi:hypothetical protein